MLLLTNGQGRQLWASSLDNIGMPKIKPRGQKDELVVKPPTPAELVQVRASKARRYRPACCDRLDWCARCGWCRT
jgi:hypothetical protein